MDGWTKEAFCAIGILIFFFCLLCSAFAGIWPTWYRKHGIWTLLTSTCPSLCCGFVCCVTLDSTLVSMPWRSRSYKNACGAFLRAFLPVAPRFKFQALATAGELPVVWRRGLSAGGCSYAALPRSP